MTKLKLILYSVFILILSACQDPNPLVDDGRDILEAYGEIVSDTLYAIADTFIVKGKVSTASSSRLLLGSHAGYETRFLLKFGNLPPDTVVIDSLRLIVSSFADFGADLGIIDGMVYRVTEPWEETVNADESWDYRLNIDYSQETSAAFSLTEPDSTTYTDFNIDLPVKLVEIWQDTSGGDQNHGILVDFISNGIIREFSSREGLFPTRYPRLIYVYHEAGTDSTIRDTVYTSRDASLIDYSGTLDPEKIYIMSGYTSRAFIEFDFSNIPKNANISSVSFFYEKDSANSAVNDNRVQDIYLRNVKTEFKELPSFEIDSTFIYSSRHNIVLYDRDGTGLILDDGVRAVAGQYFIQDLINEYVFHGSFFLQYVSEGFDVSTYAIKGVTSPQKESRPKLIIEYFLNPAGRL